MKKPYRSLTYLVLLLFIFLLLTDLIHAQPSGDPSAQGVGDRAAQAPGDPSGPGDPGCGPDYPCPLDSGLITLIAVGVGYGIKKIRSQKEVESVS